MNEARQSELLARWLDSRDGDGVADGSLGVLDAEVREAVYALRPDLAPAPGVSLDDIIDAVQEGPFASGSADGGAEAQDAAALAAWLEQGGELDLDPDVQAAMLALRPDLAPAPNVDIEDILADVSSGPFAAPGAEVIAFTPAAAPAPAPPAAAEPSEGGAVVSLARRRRLPRWAIPGVGALAVAATTLLFVTPVAEQAMNQEIASEATPAWGPGDGADGPVAKKQDRRASSARARPARAPAPARPAVEARKRAASQDYPPPPPAEPAPVAAKPASVASGHAGATSSGRVADPVAYDLTEAEEEAMDLAMPVEGASTTGGAGAPMDVGPDLGKASPDKFGAVSGRAGGAASGAAGDFEEPGTEPALVGPAPVRDEGAPPAEMKDAETMADGDAMDDMFVDEVAESEVASPRASSAPAPRPQPAPAAGAPPAPGRADRAPSRERSVKMKRSREPAEARADVRQRHPELAGVFDAAEAAANRGDYREMVKLLEPLTQHADPDVVAEASWRLGRRFLARGETDKALASVEKGLARSGAGPGQRGRLLRLRSEIFQVRGETERARDSKEAAIEETTRDVQ